jgi:hypothetical protein
MNQPTNPPSSSSLPHRLRLTSVQSYAVAIRQAVNAYPAAMRFDPRPRALATYSARFRDAMISLHRYQWPGVLDDALMQKFNTVYESLIISERPDGYCYSGTKETLAQLTPFQPGDPATSTQLVVFNPSPAVVQALAVLCSQRVLPQTLLPVKLVGAIDPLVRETCEAAYDIAFEDKTDHILLV